MMKQKKLLVLPGDGIGPEVISQTLRVIRYYCQKNILNIDIVEGDIGGASYDKHKTPITESTLNIALNEVDAVLLGAVGGPKWDNVERHLRPEAGLLKIRKIMDLYANLRPAFTFDALVDSSTLKREIVSGLDIMIVRELTSGVYFGEPRGRKTFPDGQIKAFDTQIYSESEINRVAKVAFDIAQKRDHLVTSVEKANVMESGIFWRETVEKIHKDLYSSIQLNHMYADNCAMQLVKNPKQFDVILTDNLFGDILSDCAAMLTGSLGMLPSASLGDIDNRGVRKALYEPVHGSAPDIAGQNKANPIATLLSFSMMLKYSFDCGDIADEINKAIEAVLDKGFRTVDIASNDADKIISTSGMIDEVLSEIMLYRDSENMGTDVLRTSSLK